MREALLAALVERFGDRGLRVGAPPEADAAILQRGQIRDDRDYYILSAFLRDTEDGGAAESPRQMALRLVADYEAKVGSERL